ncbi:class I SAM-dependent methyltransferase [Cryomorphaceae bacterium 1068]|nr:class I SAM-dependent methyltransferase [Cryomorphaceae bacterium 1068]
MELGRKRFQGIGNIIRFNWHFYLIACLGLALLFAFSSYLPASLQTLALSLALLVTLTITTSLAVSYYVYDLSDLYQLRWLSDADDKTVLNVNAGFDETSDLIRVYFPKVDLTICDFYNEEQHTEPSIKRARRAYPLIEDTLVVSTDRLPFSEDSFDYSLAILSAHEIRNEKERIVFFKELNRVTKSEGQIYVTEHLRDFNNFLAYSIGSFHFHSKSTWKRTFDHANLKIAGEIKSTPFITTFILKKNGASV